MLVDRIGNVPRYLKWQFPRVVAREAGGRAPNVCYTRRSAAGLNKEKDYATTQPRLVLAERTSGLQGA